MVLLFSSKVVVFTAQASPGPWPSRETRTAILTTRSPARPFVANYGERFHQRTASLTIRFGCTRDCSWALKLSDCFGKSGNGGCAIAPALASLMPITQTGISDDCEDIAEKWLSLSFTWSGKSFPLDIADSDRLDVLRKNPNRMAHVVKGYLI